MSKTTLPFAWLVSAWAAFAPVTPLSLTASAPAGAHDWYPMECCHGMDCAAVDKVEMLPGPAMATLGLGSPQTGPSAMIQGQSHARLHAPDGQRRHAALVYLHAALDLIGPSRPFGACCAKDLSRVMTTHAAGRGTCMSSSIAKNTTE
jgi:hypothetical protein